MIDDILDLYFDSPVYLWRLVCFVCRRLFSYDRPRDRMHG